VPLSAVRRHGLGLSLLGRRAEQGPCARRGCRHDIAHLAHVELLTDQPEASLDFFVNVYGLTEAGREGDSVYLRAWDDYEFHTLKLTASNTTGVGHIGYRATSEQALCGGSKRSRRSAPASAGSRAISAMAAPSVSATLTTTSSRSISTPHKYVAPPEEKPALKNQPQRNHGRGCAVRRLDHLNLLARDVAAIRDFLPKALGSRVTEQIVLDSGEVGGCWFTVNNKSYDIAYTRDHTDSLGRFHHVTYAVDQREHMLEAADIFLENGVFIETGPHKHAVQQTFFLYAYEPAGNRVEIANAGARLILDPDWQTVTWTETERKKGQAWGLKTIESFHTHGTPPAVRQEAPVLEGMTTKPSRSRSRRKRTGLAHIDCVNWTRRQTEQRSAGWRLGFGRLPADRHILRHDAVPFLHVLEDAARRLEDRHAAGQCRHEGRFPHLVPGRAGLHGTRCAPFDAFAIALGGGGDPDHDEETGLEIERPPLLVAKDDEGCEIAIAADEFRVEVGENLVQRQRIAPHGADLVQFLLAFGCHRFSSCDGIMRIRSCGRRARPRGWRR
jgi:catechol 2,3-dioxygenase